MFTRKRLSVARSSKKDEFYTLYDDVKFELDHYIDQFKGKVIYCPCDTEESAFVKYFLELEAKGLIKEIIYTSFNNGSGTDFLSDSAIDGYKHSDIIVTNPPFSLFRQFLSLLDDLDKRFIIWGTNNGVLYKKTAEMLVKERIRLGYIANKTCSFEVPSDYADGNDSKVYVENDRHLVKVAGVTVFTNLNVNIVSPLVLTKRFDDPYIKYTNFDAINCDRSSDIPIDYNGLIGVPVTYLAKHDPSKFKIIGVFNNFDESNLELGRITGDVVKLDKAPWKTRGPCINGNQPTYARLIIQKKDD